MPERVEVLLEPTGRSFATFVQWLNKASAWVGRGDLCIDSAGRLCRIGRDFARAKDEGTFPVTIYRAPQGDAAEAARAKARALLDGDVENA